MTNKKFWIIVAIVAFLGWTNLSVLAQAETKAVSTDKDGADAESFAPEWGVEDAANAGTNCFDYYQFQSVLVSLTPNKDSFKDGEEIKFAGNIINENPYPVVDGNVFARISRVNKDFYTEGGELIDEFFALQNVNLDAGETKNEEFNWQSPVDLSAGKYQVDFFFSVGKKFNLGGLPFTNEVNGGFTNFIIESKNKANITFDRGLTEVNNKQYLHIGNWPTFAPNEKITINQPLVNNYDVEKTVDVTYELYYWDSLLASDLLDTKKEKINIAANDVYKLSYTTPPITQTVYYLKITAVSGTEKSIVNIRLLSNGDRVRLNYPAITKFPLKQGDNFTLFSCFHNTSYASSSGKVVLSLFDKENQEVGKLEYNGDISSAMMADKIDLKAKKDYKFLRLKAQMFDKAGKLVDSYETDYDCKNLSSAACKKDGAGIQAPLAKTPMADAQNRSLSVLLISIVVVALAIIFLLIMLWKINKKNNG